MNRTILKSVLATVTACFALAASAQQRNAADAEGTAQSGAAQIQLQPTLRGTIPPRGSTNIQAASTSPLFLTLGGTTATDASGQSVGAVQYVVLSPSGAVDLALLSLGGRLVPVPWQLVGAGASGNASVPGRVPLMVNVDAQRLQQAPSVTLSQLSQLSQDPVHGQILAFFGLQSQNTAQGSVAVQTNTFTGSGASSNVATAPIPGAPTNTTSGVLSATGQTNGIAVPPPLGPGATDRSGVPPARQNQQQQPSISPPPDIGPGSQPAPPAGSTPPRS